MKVSIYIATSANGFISNTRNAPDWLSNEYGQGLYSICEKTKAVIMGRTTYDILAPDHLPLKNEGTTVVLTKNKQAKADNKTVTFTQNTPGEIVKMLSEKFHKEAVIIGGAMTMGQFMNAGLVNDIYLIVEPVMFGRGLSLLTGVTNEFKLNLLEVTKLNRNSVQLHYEFVK
jgi:dihydrofolate reductase